MNPTPKLLIVLTVRACLLLVTDTASAGDSFAEVLRPVFKEHCVRCHGENGTVKGEINLLDLSSADDLLADAELVSGILDAVEAGDMPPEDEPQPPAASRAAMVSVLKAMLERSIRSAANFPRTPVRRLNRAQYSNAVRDVLGLTVSVFSLPETVARGDYFDPAAGRMPDVVEVRAPGFVGHEQDDPRLSGVVPFPQDLRADYGYDNRGDHLSLSPMLMESFLNLSHSIVYADNFGPDTVADYRGVFEPENPSPDLLRAHTRVYLTRAFRQPLPDAVVERYAALGLERLSAGSSYAEALKTVLVPILASPKFLYIYETGGSPGELEPLTDLELATRLSFFLLNSVPDAELLAAASAGTLQRDDVLVAHVDRLLRSKPLKGFTDAFPIQWLQLDRLHSLIPDRKKFPNHWVGFGAGRPQLMIEPLLLFETVLIENRPLLDLIEPDFAYRTPLTENWTLDDDSNKRAKEARGSISYRRVSDPDRRTSGIITNPGILAMTSAASHTQPINRGEWIISVIFHDPPKPPPADVPALPDKNIDPTMTIRERFAAHRERSDCAACHNKLDPLGFAMENYDAIGKWRDMYENGRAIDASGMLFKKHAFTNPIEFKDAVLEEKDRFTHAFATHLLSYALGRETTAKDEPALGRIVEAARRDAYRIHSVIRHVVLSDPFRQKFTPSLN